MTITHGGQHSGQAATDDPSSVNDAAFFAIPGAFSAWLPLSAPPPRFFRASVRLFAAASPLFRAALRSGTARMPLFFAADGALHAIVGAPSGNGGAFWPVGTAKSRNDADFCATSAVTFDTRSFTPPWVQSCVAPFEVLRGSRLSAQSCAGTRRPAGVPIDWSRM